MNKPRIFVSSVMDDFTEYRNAVRRGIAAAGGESVLVEDYPSLTSSSRSACLDGVASSDALIVIIGSRGGWTAPSGKLVVEEEYDEARRRKIPVLLFIQSLMNRDEKAQALVERLSDYVEGLFRKTFSTPTELQELVSMAVIPIIEQKEAPVADKMALSKLLSDAPKMGDEVVMRFVLMPERADTFIDAVEIDSAKFRHDLMAIAHAPEVMLLSYERPKKFETGISNIKIIQIGQEDRRDVRDEKILDVATTGTIIIDTNVTGRTRYRPSDRDSFGQLFFIVEHDITEQIVPSFSFANTLYTNRDPFRRYDRFLYNVALHNVGQRILVAQMPNTNSFAMSQAITAPVSPFDDPQLLNRDDLANPSSQIDAILSLLRRRIKPRDWFGQPL